MGIRRLADGEVTPPDLLAIGVEKDHEAGATNDQIHERVDVVLLKAESTRRCSLRKGAAYRNSSTAHNMQMPRLRVRFTR